MLHVLIFLRKFSAKNSESSRVTASLSRRHKRKGRLARTSTVADVCEDRVLLAAAVLDGTAGDDAFVLTYSPGGTVQATLSTNGGSPSSLGTFSTSDTLTVQGFGGFDSVRIVGTGNADQFDMEGAILVVNQLGSVDLTGLEELTIAGGAGGDRYGFDADTAIGLVELEETAAGLDTIDLSLTTTLGVAVNLNLSAPQVVNANLTLDLSSATAFESVIGGSGNDTLTGNALANIIVGGDGDDVMTGAAGHDSYVFETAFSAESDSIVEFDGGGTDTLDFFALTTAVDVNLGTTAAQSVHTNRTLSLNSATTIENVYGGTGNDTLTGNTQANALNGGRGSDTLTGGTGNDLYRFAAAAFAEADVVVEVAGGGTDTLHFGDMTTAVSVDLSLTTSQAVTSNRTLTLSAGSTIENVIGGLGNDTLTGDASANMITGGAGQDLINGGEGDDVLIGGLNHDSYVFTAAASAESDSIVELDGGGTDTLDFFALTTAVNVNLGTTAAQLVHTNRTLTLNSATTIENVYGGTGNDTLTGNTQANALNGGRGSDTLTGGTGNDLYRFAAAVFAEADVVVEAAGADIDTLHFGDMTTAVTVDLSSSTSQTVNSNRTLTLIAGTAIENVIGGLGNDTLTGNASANVITGGAGQDLINGREGDDVLIGGLHHDTYVFTAAASSEADSIVELDGGGTDTLDFFALSTAVNLNLGTTAAQSVHTNRTLTLNSATTIENVFGGTGNDTLTGNNQVNALNGGRGSDTLTGAAGNDLYRFAGAAFAEGDSIVEVAGGGTDTLHFGDMTTAVNLDIGSLATQNVSVNRTLTLSAATTIENVIGGSGSDSLTGNAESNVLVGAVGNDQLTGLDARDILIGGLGIDSLFGGNEEDILIAGVTSVDAAAVNLISLQTTWNGADSYATRVTSLRAGAGSPITSLKAQINVFDDGGADDTLTGGAGNDWYFRAVDDVISGLVSGEEIDNL